MVYTQTRIRLGEWDTQNANRSPNSIKKTRQPSDNKQKKKKRTCRMIDFAVPKKKTQSKNKKKNEKVD